MSIADVIVWSVLVSGTLAAIVAYWLAATALFPGTVARSDARYGSRPILASLLGIAILLPIVVLALALVERVQHPVAHIAALLLMAVPLLLALLGSAGLARRIGGGLGGRSDGARALRGGIVLALTLVAPFLGWFVVLPWVLVSGLGCAVLAIARRDGARVIAPSQETVPTQPAPGP